MDKQATFADRLKEALKLRGITKADLSRMTGISKSSLTHYERGDWEGKQDAVYKIARAVNVSESWLMGFGDSSAIEPAAQSAASLPSNIIPMPAMRRIPLVGIIACGTPILAQENVEGEVSVPEHVHADFALRCKGDSMINARIYDGDVVYIRQQETVESGEIAAVLIDDEATLKRVKLYPDHISLEPENPQYRPLVFWENDMNSVRILGLAVAFTSTVR